MTTAKKQTLIQAIKLAHSGKSRDMARALTALAGCPEGGWGETTQGMRQIADYLPLRSARTYTVGHFVEAAYVVGERTMRYDTRDEAAALREAARIEAASG